MTTAPTLLELAHDKVKTYHVDVNETIERATKLLRVDSVKSIELHAVGQEITKVSLIAIRLEEELKDINCKIVKMVTDNKIEKVEGEREKKHLRLKIVL
jgi:transketolase